jgi:hypothetical protein
MAGTWNTLANSPPESVATTLLLTDGTVLAHGYSSTGWYRLTPDATGSYVNGTWSAVARSTNAPLYYASGVLRDGRVIVAGGEYNFGPYTMLLAVEAYDPVANTWTTLPTPAGWVRIGDAPGCVLPDGRFFLGQVASRATAIYDPVANAWTAAADKTNTVGEESWSLLPDGTVHAVDCSNPPNAEKYVIAADAWVPAGQTPDRLVDTLTEIGASVLLPDGRLFVIGATGATALYTPPPVANQVGTWERGPTIPQVNPNQPLGTVDAPACLLPNGNVLFSASPITTPATFQSPTFFFEYDPAANAITAVPNAANSGGPSFVGRMLMLPSGQVLLTTCSATVEVYTPSGAPDPVWRPTVTSVQRTGWVGRHYHLRGRQINGLSQGAYYGNDATQATNYPIVRLEATNGNVYYCRTSNFSTMGLQTGTVVHGCDFTIPASVPNGSYCLRVVANGIASDQCTHLAVSSKRFHKEIKAEIKEKLEIIEKIKDLRDDYVAKRLPDIVDVKGIRENDPLVDLIQDEWTRTVRRIAETVDQANEELARSFIAPGERPRVGPPEPQVEELVVPEVSAEEAERLSDKRLVLGETREVLSQDLEELHEVIHNLWRSGGDVDLRDNPKPPRPPRGKPAKPAKTGKPVERQSARARDVRDVPPPPRARKRPPAG